MPRFRTSAALFEQAARARTDDEPSEGAVGARGFGFVLANQLESKYLLPEAGGSKLINVPRDGSGEGAQAAGRALTLTGGEMRISPHVEELFDLLLCAVSPGGGRDAFRFYSGPSGLALGSGYQTGRDAPAADLVADAWQEALAKVAPVEFSVRADSDFGKILVGKQGAPPHRIAWDPASLVEAEARAAAAVSGVDAAQALRDVHAAWYLGTLATKDDLQARYHDATAPLWGPAFEWFEAELAALPDDAAEMPPLVEQLRAIAPFPQSGDALASLDKGRLRVACERARAIGRRSVRAYPFP